MQTKPKKILVLWWNHLPANQTRLTMLHHIHTLDESPIPHKIISITMPSHHFLNGLAI